jgi:hypothetical protein
MRRLLLYLSAGLLILSGCNQTNQATQPRPGSETASTKTASTEPAPPAVGGPIPGTRITEAYARMVARDAYFWAWPMVNLYNRRLAFEHAPEPGLIGGILPFAPVNHLSMLHDYVEPQERQVACPNQAVVYGGSVLALDKGPAVV